MPDPFEYLKAVLAAIVASTTILLAFRVLSWKRGSEMPETASVVAMAGGMLAGYFTLNFSWPWPPANALDRFLTIVLPAILVIEFIAAINGDCVTLNFTATGSTAGDPNNRSMAIRKSRAWLWIGRSLLCCGIGRILMHGSIYLDASNGSTREAWLIQNMPGILLICSPTLMAMWFALVQLAARGTSSGIVLSLSLSLICAGCTTMMAGYIKGGASALPLATVLMVSAVVPQDCFSRRIDSVKRFNRHTNGTAAIGVGLVSLFSLLWIGRFFGQLTSIDAIVMFLAPSLCWITELPSLRKRSATLKFAIRLILVIVPLAILLAHGKREFDEKMAPLL